MDDANAQAANCVREARSTVFSHLPIATVVVGGATALAHQFIPAFRRVDWRPKLVWGLGLISAYSYFKGDRALEQCRRAAARSNVLTVKREWKEHVAADTHKPAEKKEHTAAAAAPAAAPKETAAKPAPKPAAKKPAAEAAPPKSDDTGKEKAAKH
jgi:cell division septation protein DedD